MVGVAGLEPAASWSRTKRDTKLRHTPATFVIIPTYLMFVKCYFQRAWCCMCQAFIGKVSFDERRVFKMQLPGLCPVYVYSKAHRLTAALA